jgi:hypothetical protein
MPYPFALHFVDDKTAWLHYDSEMSSVDFQRWLAAMGISSAAAARLLGVNANTITRYKKAGAPRVVALACAALFHRLGEWK